MNNIKKKLCLFLPLLLLITLISPISFTHAAVTNVNGFFREGQTFLTWQEDSGLTGEKYRIYRHTAPITSSNLDSAQLVAEVEEDSGRFREMYDMDGNLLSSDSANIIARFVIEDMGPQLVSGTGLFVYTVKETASRQSYYAVTVVDGANENRSITALNSTGPITEVKQQIGAVKYCDTVSEGQTRDWYIMWMDYDLYKDSYMGYAFAVSLTRNSFTNSGSMPSIHLDGIGTMNVYTAYYSNYGQGDLYRNGAPTWYFGYHKSTAFDGTGRTGMTMEDTVANYIQYRVMQAVLWARSKYNITQKKFKVIGNSMGASGAYGFALAYPSFVTSVYCCEGLTDYENSGMTGGGDIMWADSIRGNYGEPELENPVELLPFNNPTYPELDWYTQFNGMNVYDFRNVADFLKANTDKDFGMICSGHGLSDGSIQYESQGRHFEQYIKDSRHCFSYHVTTDGHGWGTIEGNSMDEWMRWDESRPGFSNVPAMPVYRFGDYDFFEEGGRGYLLSVCWGTAEHPFEGRKIEETETSWSIPICVERPGNTPAGWNDSVLEYNVNITPRNLQRMQVTRGDVFSYTIEALNGTVLSTGTIVADEMNLLLIPQVPIRVAGVIAKVEFVSHGSSAETTPLAPSNLTAVNTQSTRVYLRWSDNSGNETGFEVERRTGSSASYQKIHTTGASETTYTDNNLQPSTNYYYRVRAINSAGQSSYSNECSTTTPTDDYTRITVTNVQELLDSVSIANNGNCIVEIADGTYSGTAERPLSIPIRGNNVIYRSQSGNRDNVILDGNLHGGSIFEVIGDNVTIQDISICEAYFHGIQVHCERDSDNAVIKNIRFFNIREQMIKGSADSNPVYGNDCLVEDCLFEFTSGKSLQYYTGGIDVHRGQNWIVRNNIFRNIRYEPDESLTDGAIHFWSDSSGTIIENNTIINCDRGVVLGLHNNIIDHTGGIVRNNFIHVTIDTGIYLGICVDTNVYNNTIYVDSNYQSAIEYRYPQTTGVHIANNLSNRTIWLREGASGTVENNVVNAEENWFVNARQGDLHLSYDVSNVVNSGLDLAGITTDIDGEVRPSGQVDIGADEHNGTMNHPPVLAAIGAKSVNAGNTLSFTVSATDQDNATTLNYSAAISPAGALPQGASFNAATRTFSWTPTNSQTGSHTIRFTVSDGELTDYEDVVITVNASVPPVNNTTVTFHRNGGDTEANPTIKTVTAGQAVGSLPTAPTRSGYTFKGWNTAANGNGTALTAQTVVNSNITVYAQWQANATGDSGGNGGNGGNDGSGNPLPIVIPPLTVTPPPAITPAPTATSNNAAVSGHDDIKNLTGNVDDASKRYSIDLNEAQAKSLFRNMNNTTINIPAIPGVNAYTLKLPVVSLQETTKRDSMTILTEAGQITIPNDLLSGLKISGSTASITIRAGDKTQLGSQAKSLIGDSPLIQISLSVDGKEISGNIPTPITVSIPYTPSAEELKNPESIVIWALDQNGKATVVPNGQYDALTKTVTFKTSSFGQYAVGSNITVFNDVPASAWYAKAVRFAAARGIASGTGNNKFDPDGQLTRSQVLVMIMRAYGIAPDSNTPDNFKDAGNTWYTGYLAAAKKLGITKGIGNNMFAPDNTITRQEMCALLYNALKLMGELPEGSSGAGSGTTQSAKSLKGFTDTNQVADWAKDAMTALIETGTINGSNGKLSPADNADRAQMVQMLYNLLSK